MLVELLSDVIAVCYTELITTTRVLKLQSRTCRAVLEHLRDQMIVLFRANFEGLVFSVAPAKIPRNERPNIPPADMSTLIPSQHALFVEGKQD